MQKHVSFQFNFWWNFNLLQVRHRSSCTHHDPRPHLDNIFRTTTLREVQNTPTEPSLRTLPPQLSVQPAIVLGRLLPDSNSIAVLPQEQGQFAGYSRLRQWETEAVVGRVLAHCRRRRLPSAKWWSGWQRDAGMRVLSVEWMAEGRRHESAECAIEWRRIRVDLITPWSWITTLKWWNTFHSSFSFNQTKLRREGQT